MYEAASGFNNTAGYTELDPPPRLEIVEDGRVLIGGDGIAVSDGARKGELIWDFLTVDQYTALLTIFGLTTSKGARITIAIPLNDDRTFSDTNTIIEKAAPRFIRGRYLDVRFPLRIIAEI